MPTSTAPEKRPAEKRPAEGANRLGVVLVSYGHSGSIERLVGLLAAEKRPGDRIVVVDNHPSHDCAAVAEKIEAVDRIIRSENVGFGAGCNLGTAEIEDEVDLLLFLNPDSVPEKGAIAALREGGREEWDAWSGLLLLPDGRINSATTTVHASGLSWCGCYGRLPEECPPQLEPGALSGADLVVRTAAWKRLGGFSPGYFLYYEDTDLCFRLRLSGSSLGIVPEARVVHDYEFDKSPEKWFFLERNRYFFIVRTWPAAVIVSLMPLLALSEIGLWVASAFQGRFSIRVRALFSFLRALPRLWKERRAIGKERVVSAYECLLMLEPRIDTPLLARPARSRFVNAAFVGYFGVAAVVLRAFARRPRRSRSSGNQDQPR